MSNSKTGTLTNINAKQYSSFRFPLPPIEVQREIVAEIEGYQKIIDGARQVVENYRPCIPIDPDWPMVEVQEVVSTITPPAKIQKKDFGLSGRYPIIDQSQEEIAGWTDDENAIVATEKGVVIFGDHTCAVKYVDRPFAQGADGIKILNPSERLVPKFLYFVLKAFPIEQEGYKRHFSKLKETKIPLPDIESQREIVERLETEVHLVNSNKELIRIFEEKIKQTINRVWGEAKPSPSLTKPDSFEEALAQILGNSEAAKQFINEFAYRPMPKAYCNNFHDPNTVEFACLLAVNPIEGTGTYFSLRNIIRNLKKEVAPSFLTAAGCLDLGKSLSSWIQNTVGHSDPLVTGLSVFLMGLIGVKALGEIKFSGKQVYVLLALEKSTNEGGFISAPQLLPYVNRSLKEYGRPKMVLRELYDTLEELVMLGVCKKNGDSFALVERVEVQ